jgi:hypothetical protein
MKRRPAPAAAFFSAEALVRSEAHVAAAVPQAYNASAHPLMAECAFCAIQHRSETGYVFEDRHAAPRNRGDERQGFSGPWLWILAVCLAGCGSSSFEQRFKQVRYGMPRAGVVRLLGQPTDIQRDSVGELPPGDVSEILVDLLPEGTPYELWRYPGARIDCYVWFAAGDEGPSKGWNVVHAARRPARPTTEEMP